MRGGASLPQEMIWQAKDVLERTKPLITTWDQRTHFQSE